MIETKISPIDIGTIHIIGIGGIGMSGIAEVLHQFGYKIQGSDNTESYVTDRLKSLGIKFFKGHQAENIEGANLIVKSTAVKDDNPEIMAALAQGIPIIKRSEMLAEIMRFKHCIAVSGTHGKTTTTSMVAKMLDEAGLYPTVINGGIINEIGSNVRWSKGDYLVVEADESDGTFIKIPSFIAIITNIDPEHLDYYGNFEAAKLAYVSFIENLPFYGFGVLCFDHPVVREISAEIKDRRFFTYGLNPEYNPDLLGKNIRLCEKGSTVDVYLSEKLKADLKVDFEAIKDVMIGIHGEHNVQNALSAVLVALKLGISPEVIKNAFAHFQGVKRRFTKVGEVKGARIIDDYAHHPSEIVATLKTARRVADLQNGKVIAIVQPHRYSRLNSLMKEFSLAFKDADKILVAQVYPAGENPIPGADSEGLVANIQQATKQDVILLHDEQKIAIILDKVISRGDVVIFLGAGNITKWAYDLPNELEAISNSN
jgi:UDP-N-acetylmuramate--alanine ligase